MINSLVSSSRMRSKTVLLALYMLFSFNTPFSHAHEHHNDTDKRLPTGHHALHGAAAHIADHEHSDNLLTGSFSRESGFHSHDSSEHMHFAEEILSSLRTSSRPTIKLFAKVHSLLTEDGDIHLLKRTTEAVPYNPPLRSSRSAVLSFTDLPPPRA